MNRDSQASQATQSIQASQVLGASERTKWYQDEVDMLLEWLSSRDPNGVLRNAIAYKKHASDAAKRIHRETQLVESKPEVTPKMIWNKLRTMNNTYLKMRSTVETTGWGVDPAGHDKAITIRSWVLKRCAWYYDFETLFGSSPNVSAPFLSESGQPDRVNSRPTGGEGENAARTREGEVQAELDKIRFEAEQKQRDQQHAILLQQGQERIMLQKETLLRLQLQLKGAQDEGGESI